MGINVKEDPKKLIPEGEYITGERFPEDEFGLGLFLFAFSAAIGNGLAGGGIPAGIGKKEDADSSYQDKKKYADIGFGFHDRAFAFCNEIKKKKIIARQKFSRDDRIV